MAPGSAVAVLCRISILSQFFRSWNYLRFFPHSHTRMRSYTSIAAGFIFWVKSRYLFIYYIENKFDSQINFIYIHRNNEHLETVHAKCIQFTRAMQSDRQNAVDPWKAAEEKEEEEKLNCVLHSVWQNKRHAGFILTVSVYVMCAVHTMRIEMKELVWFAIIFIAFLATMQIPYTRFLSLSPSPLLSLSHTHIWFAAIFVPR